MKNKSSGYSLIEFALSFVLSIPVIFITLDISKIMQAKSVGKAAVSTAVRCLSVTDDSRCSQVSASTAKPVYNVILSGSNQQIEPQVSYDGDVKYLEGPEYQLGPFRVLILDKSFLQIKDSWDLNASVNFYDTEAQVSYMELDDRRVPRIISGTDRDPEFESGFNTINIQGRGIQSSYSNNGPTTRFSYTESFSVPDIFTKGICLGNKSYSKNLADYQCTGESDGAKYVRGILHVKGIGRSISSSAVDPSCTTAKLYLEELELNNINGNETIKNINSISLTGQTFTGIVKNFVPRGYLKGEEGLIKAAIAEKYDSGVSTEALGKEIKFRTDRKYRISVKVSPGNKENTKCVLGDGSFEITGAQVYFPALKSRSQIVQCSEQLTDCETSTVCTEKGNQFGNAKLNPEVFQKILQSGSIIKSSLARTSTVDCGQNLANQQSFNQITKSSLRSKECACNSSTLSIVPAAQTTFESNCSSENFGVADGAISGSKLTNSEEAKNICPLQLPLFDFGSLESSQLTYWWSLKNKTLAADHKLIATSCQDKDNIVDRACAYFYPEYKRPQKDETSIRKNPTRKLIQTGKESSDFPAYDAQDPAIIIKTEKYKCGDFSVKSFKAHELQKSAAFHSGFLDNPASTYANCLGSEDTNHWKRMLATELRINYKDTENAFFSPKYLIKNSIKYGLKDQHYDTSCPALRTCNSEIIQSITLPETTDGSSLPAICFKQCNSCQLKIKSFEGSTETKINFNYNSAKELAQQQLNTFSPWMGKDCGEANCAEIFVDTNEQMASAKAKIKVPLFSKQIVSALGLSNNASSFVEITEQAQRPMERMIAGQ